MRLKIIVPVVFILGNLSAQEMRVAVYLTNGERFEGVVEVTDDEQFLTLAVDGTRLNIPRALIKRIVNMHREMRLLILCHPDRTLAEQFREELQRGALKEDIERLLRLSCHPSVATEGRTGFITEERLPEALASEVFAAEKGEVVGPVSVGGYYYVVKVESVRWVEPEERKPKVAPKKASLKKKEKKETKKTVVEKSTTSEKKKTSISITVLPFKTKNEEADVEMLHEKLRLSVYRSLKRTFRETKMEDKVEGSYSVEGEIGAKSGVCSLRLVLKDGKGEVLYDTKLQTLTRNELDKTLEKFLKALVDRLREDVDENTPGKKQP